MNTTTKGDEMNHNEEEIRAGVGELLVNRSTPLKEVLRRHEGVKELGLPAGIALVVDERGRLIGTITDGDIRRALLEMPDLTAPAERAMRRDPIVFPETWSYQEILRRLPQELEMRGRRSRRFLGKIVLVDSSRRPVRVVDYHKLWEQRVATHRHVVVIGMGYVGLTLALELAEEGFRVTGFDVDDTVVQRLARGDSHVHERGLPDLLHEQLQNNFEVTNEIPVDGDVYVIAVGTPVARRKSNGSSVLELEYIRNATKSVGGVLKPGDLVVLRSTIPVGFSRSEVMPILETTSRLKGGTDFHLAFAPERTAEGKALEELRELPQIIGGLNADSVEAAVALFRELTPTIVRVESIEAAEMAKLLNNGFRDLVFAFSNEAAQMAAAHNLDIIEVIRAANHGYPRDQVPLPSPGVGGPCLTKDPYILASAGKTIGRAHTLGEHGREVNESMHEFVAEAVGSKLRALGKIPSKTRVLVCGMAFKGHPETGDMRDSSSRAISGLLKSRGISVFANDPVIDASEIERAGFEPVLSVDEAENMDAILFLNNHPHYQRLNIFEVARSLTSPGIVYDAWRLFRPDDVLSAVNCVYMGLGFARSSLPDDLGGSSYL